MLKKTITYDDYNGVSHTEDFYFNLTKAELVELELTEKGGFSEALTAIVATNDGKAIVENFKRIILLAYGEKSEDGKYFDKNEKLSHAFSQTEAYSQLFVELATNAESAAQFINSVVPTALSQQLSLLPNVTDIPLPEPTEGVVAFDDAPTPSLADDNAPAPPAEKDPKDMTREELLEAMKAKNQAE